VITLDTSGLLALIDSKDPDHEACTAVFAADRGPYLISVAILTEIAWFLQTRFPTHVEDIVLDDIEQDAYTLDWDRGDFVRIRRLAQKYRSLRLGLADAAVIACAERNRGRVLTTDRRHFPVVARGEKTITVLPA
jgi:uncharacterized protein